MIRDATATRERILAAASAEFARHGLAGARINRIAEQASANKSLLYQYFGNKDDLFDAVFDAMVVQTVRDIPLDPDDLAEYAALLFDQHVANPDPLRISQWDRLERDGMGARRPAVVQATQDKLAAIAAAQADGRIGDRLPATAILDAVIALSRSGPIDQTPPADARAVADHRAAIKETVGALVDPAR